MVNRANMIHGRNLDKHPLSGRLAIYAKHGQVIAAQAGQSGVIDTPEGQMTFQAGDWILTDNPPTHAWPVRDDVFRATYNLVSHLEPGQIPIGPPVKPIEQPKVSAPPVDVNEVKAAELAAEHVRRAPDEEQPRGIATTETLGIAERKKQ